MSTYILHQHNILDFFHTRYDHFQEKSFSSEKDLFQVLNLKADWSFS